MSCSSWLSVRPGIWSHGADSLLGFHDHSEFRALDQEGFKQGGDLGCLINRLRLVAVS